VVSDIFLKLIEEYVTAELACEWAVNNSNINKDEWQRLVRQAKDAKRQLHKYVDTLEERV
jgi:hypothetical protein